MEIRPLTVDTETVELDVCTRCGGVFFDYFDGEPGALARRLEVSFVRRGIPDNPVHCTDCEEPMTLTEWLDNGPSLFRCTSCMAIFATPEMIAQLAVFTVEPEPEPSWFARLWRSFAGE